jgi:hypothetical protein
MIGGYDVPPPADVRYFYLAAPPEGADIAVVLRRACADQKRLIGRPRRLWSATMDAPTGDVQGA